MTRRHAALLTAACYVAFFGSQGAHLPFWPLWLGDWGLGPAAVGLFGAIGMGTRVIAGLLIPALADRLDARRTVTAACALASAALFVAHLWIDSFGMLLAATIAIGTGFAALGPLCEALGVAAARSHGFVYAPVRGIGSIGFLTGNLVVGAWAAQAGTQVVLWWIVACLVLVAVFALRHPGGAQSEVSPPRLREILRLLLSPTFALFVAAVAMTQASHSVLYGYASLHWQALGLGEGRIGALWALSVGAEVIYMVTIGARVAARLGPIRGLALACLAGLLRWALLMADPTGWLLWPLQTLHAVTFSVGHLATITFIAQAVPGRYGGAAQGAIGSSVGLMLALGMAGAAAVYPALGGMSYGIGVAFSAAGLGLAVALGRRWDGKPLPV